MELAATRIFELDTGEWIAQYMGGFGWSQLGDETFSTKSEALAYLSDQIANADLD